MPAISSIVRGACTALPPGMRFVSDLTPQWHAVRVMHHAWFGLDPGPSWVVFVGIPNFNAVDVKAAAVKLHFPGPVDPDRIRVNLFSGAAEARWKIIDPETILFSGKELAPGDQFEIKVDFPAGMVERKFSLNKFIRAKISPYLPFVFPFFTLLIMAFLYIRLGRDYEVKGIPKIVTQPPSDLAPALAGTVIDEEAGSLQGTQALLGLDNGQSRRHEAYTATLMRSFAGSTSAAIASPCLMALSR